jgi:hypothetical protein
MWRTGAVVYHDLMRELLGLKEGDIPVAHLYVGYPDMGERPRRREPASEKTVWHGG